MKRTMLFLGILLISACRGEQFTGPAAQDAAERYKSTAVATSSGIVFVLDGKQITSDEFEALDPNSISSIEVIKGEAARAALKRPDARAIIYVESKK